MKKAIQIRNATVHLPKLMTWMLVYLFCAAPLFAQTSRVITGTVTDASGETMAGAIANIKNTTTATTTDVKGKFTLTIPGNVENPVLVISYLGYLSQEMTVGNTADFSIVLQENATMLDDVVVVGYGTQKRVTMTSAVSTVKGGEIAKLPVPRVSTGLGGMVSGVVTFQSGGAAPGADAASIYVHGVTPLILVDGVDRPHDRIDTEDIESISVLRDAAAVAPYGLQGANGVILITT
ncbi:MAG: carboxypeptidase-like regulatory domain-containing protein, partial [Dysgonamonadaceae bacterium]|nr:carboxypeptidase-like regulatory domain-containing protein [Dysgonamonadaceae bacterium]